MAEGEVANDRKNSLKGKNNNLKEILCIECNEICAKEDKNTLSCDSCKNWYHRGCTGIKTSEWKVLISNQNINYVCDNCLEKKGNEASEIREIKEMLKEHLIETRKCMSTMEERIYVNVEKIIDEKIKKQSQNQVKLEGMIKEVKEVEVNLENKIEEGVKTYLDNKKEKEEKASNIIVLRLAEQPGNDEDEQNENDKKEIKKLLEKTNPELSAEIDNVLSKKKSHRLGKRRAEVNKPRPIKIELPDVDIKKQIFKGCRNLKNSTYSQ